MTPSPTLASGKGWLIDRSEFCKLSPGLGALIDRAPWWCPIGLPFAG